MGEQMNLLFNRTLQPIEPRRGYETDGHIVKTSLYNGKYALEFNEKTHRYKINGIYIGGVTTILKRLDKGEGLIQWAANLAVEAYKKGADEQQAKKAWVTFRDDAANIGKAAHSWISHYLTTGEELEVGSDIEPCINSFHKWLAGILPTNMQSERIVFSAEHNYCGTCDMVFNAKIGNTTLRIVGDFKTGSPEKEWTRLAGYTGKNRAYAEHFYQCALYDQALQEEDGKRADAYMVIYLTKDGKLFSYLTPDTSAYSNAALHAVRLSTCEKELKRIHVY